MASPRVVDLSQAPGAGESWDAPAWKVYAWGLVEVLLVSNPLQVSSRVRRAALRAFGARIGTGVILRPRLRVRFPWKLEIGDRSWIGEDVWLHNQDRISIGSDAVVSQGTFITTGAWITARCIVLGGSQIGVSALITPGTVVSGEIPDAVVFGQPRGVVLGPRFP
jgi:putative colanic acid biosynthesis acetyltransferase WcaF